MRPDPVTLAALIDGQVIACEWARFLPSYTGRPVISPRPMAGLLCLQPA